MIAVVGGMAKVSGSRIATPLAPPRPGRTPMITPRIAVETDNWWHKQLEVLDGDYPHSLKQPQGNHYGMHFFSKLELRSPAVRFLVEDDVPSVRAGMRLRSGHWIEFYGIHPRPPEVPEMAPLAVDLTSYDELLVAEVAS